MTPRSAAAWHHLNDDDLLRVRLCDLRVSIEGSEIESRIRLLFHELESRGLSLRPRCYLSDEWLSPSGHAAIGVPFFLAHPRLKALEFRMMFEVEGGTPNWCMKLLRHEAGHAFDHAYGLHRREDWERIFGSPRRHYDPYYYTVDPRSKKHVRNLPDNYAQCHPEEDFAETFAVWLNPSSQWRSRYRGWPAARKLRYVDRLMREIVERPLPRRRPRLQNDVRRLRTTLRTYYRRKFKLYQFGDLEFSVRDLKKIFRPSRAAAPPEPAAAFVRGHKRELVDAITSWSGAGGSQVASVVARLAKLCDENRLALRDGEDVSLVRLATYAATLITNHVHTQSYRGRKR